MVGIFKRENGLKFVAVSENFETAVEALAKRFKNANYDHMTPMEWWEYGKQNFSCAAHSYEIREIESWN